MKVHILLTKLRTQIPVGIRLRDVTRRLGGSARRAITIYFLLMRWLSYPMIEVAYHLDENLSKLIALARYFLAAHQTREALGFPIRLLTLLASNRCSHEWMGRDSVVRTTVTGLDDCLT